MNRETTKLTCADHVPADLQNYGDWYEWADQMSKTHTQIRCPECGLYKIWIPKEACPDPDYDDWLNKTTDGTWT